MVPALRRPATKLARRSNWPRALSATLVVASLVVAACGGGDNSSSSDTQSGSATSTSQSGAKSLLPDDIKSSGEIHAATNAEYPPWQYLDGDRIVGLEVDVNEAIAERLGVKMVYSNVSFDAVMPGIQSKRYDMGSSTVTDTKEREQVADFVDFYRKVNVLIVKAGNPEGVNVLADMCGKVAAAQSGTDWSQLFQEQNKKCKAAGKPGITLKELPANTDTALAVQTGRAAATLEDYVSATLRAEQSDGELEVLTDETYQPSMYGAAFPKGSELAKAWQAGLQEIIDDGTYDEIFAKWRIKDGLVKTAQLNGALS